MLGFNELFIIFIIILFIFGPDKLPKIGKIIGKSIGEFKKAQQITEIEDIFNSDNYLLNEKKNKLNNLILQASEKLCIDKKDNNKEDLLISILEKIIESQKWLVYIINRI